MRKLLNIKIVFFCFVFISLSFAQERILESFENTENWKVYKSDGVDIKVSSVKGNSGNAVKMEYNFIHGAGYGGIQKFIPVDYPENYQFSFWLKSESPANNLEFKLIDKSGDNVWWVNNRNYDFPDGWKKVVIKKRKIGFAWGPAEDKSLKKTDRIEFTIASYVGGKGYIIVDDLRFEQLPPVSNEPVTPEFISNLSNRKITSLNDGNISTTWKRNPGENITVDLKGMKEIGGVEIIWKTPAKAFELKSSVNNKNYETLLSADNNFVNKSILYLPETETSFLQLSFGKNESPEISEIKILPVDYSSSINRFFINKAKELSKGFYPRYCYEQKSYWTVVGWVNSRYEALMNEDGMVEVDKKNFSIEPFIFSDGTVYNWNNSKITHKLHNDYMPIPYAELNTGDLNLEVKSFGYGEDSLSSLNIVYTLKNVSQNTKSGKLFLALRPFQVNPYYQELNMTGGFAKISSVKKISNNKYGINNKTVYLSSKPEKFFVSSLNNGDVVDQIYNGSFTNSSNELKDNTGFLSAGFEYSYSLKPGESIQYSVTVPFEENKKVKYSLKDVNNSFAKAVNYWDKKLNKVEFNVPDDAKKIVNTIKSTLGYILINRDGAGIQPGSRSYERSWIRDGSLTSSALMKMGIIPEVKDFVNWFSKYQYPDGKIPCVVDTRGGDPTPENDSHGQYIYLLKQYFNFTKDTLTLKQNYKHIQLTVDYIESLLNSRSTDFYKNGNDSIKSMYGLMPESISHEGYSDKPRHSYWDDFFTIKGLKDAVEIAKLLGMSEDVKRFSDIRDTFSKNLYNSISLSIKRTGIDYIPGCAELGDFDATSTTVALNPCGEIHKLPQPYLDNTFNKYYDFFTKRKLDRAAYGGYTPYENRVIGSFLFLNQPEKAHDLISFFLNDNRPYEWNQWAEVVWPDYRFPKFIGDMPHTWCGSDFINSCRALFVYEDEENSTLIIGAGIKKEWISTEKGISIKNFPTYYGDISYSINKTGNKFNIKITGDSFKIPSNGILIKNVTKDPIVIKTFPAIFSIEE